VSLPVIVYLYKEDVHNKSWGNAIEVVELDKRDGESELTVGSVVVSAKNTNNAIVVKGIELCAEDIHADENEQAACRKNSE